MDTVRKASCLAVVLAVVPASGLASPEIVLPLKLAGHFAVIMAKIDGLEVPLIFGTGDSPAVVLQQSVLDHIKAPPAPPDATSMGLDVKGNRRLGELSGEWRRIAGAVRAVLPDT